ncbi:MAG: helix-turn-helix transcriptional regulator, partial [Myxococcales bacterium]|nr:helix-turn-helix transcriptional regulator [Myxococcales bacterium]
MSSGRSFGRHIRMLRKARRLTQEILAERSGLSADTIRRLEHGSFSPSLDTLKKLCSGLDLTLATFFESYEVGELDPSESLRAVLRSRTKDEVRIVMSVVYSLI